MSNIKDQKTDQRQLSIIDFCDSLVHQQQATQPTIIQSPKRRVSRSRQKALKRVIDHAKGLNW